MSLILDGNRRIFSSYSRKSKSVFGFVSSVNPSMSQWLSQSGEQRAPSLELVDALRVAMTKALTQ